MLMNYKNKILELADKHNGYITTKEVSKKKHS